MRGKRSTGILPSQTIREMITGGQIVSDAPVSDGQIQPSSIDLRLGDEAYRVRASFLPGRNATVAERLETLAMHKINLKDGAVLERGCVYIVRLQESVSLPPRISGVANPKSSTGRLDIFTRLITDYGTEFESVRDGYDGPLYAEISPRTFSILARTGSRLNQVRFRRGQPVASDAAMRRLQDSVVLVHGRDADIREGVAVSVDLTGEPKTGLIGYKARQHTGLIDIDRPGSYEVPDFWEPLYRQKDRLAELVLDPDEFYILASKEYLSVPLDYAAEMRAYDTKVGEFRVHYAGFFDPGFGLPEAGGEATRGVLEVRSHDVPLVISDGQIVCRLIYEPLIGMPDRIYGTGGIGSNYQGQGLKLGKHFRN